VTCNCTATHEGECQSNRVETPDTRYGYSYDGEVYHGEYESRDDAVAEAVEGREKEVTMVYTGRCIVVDFTKGAFDADDIFERVEDYNEVISDFEPFSHVTKEQRTDLETRLSAVFDTWIHEVNVRYYSVADVQEHILIAETDA
jgi:hypothetical protein